MMASGRPAEDFLPDISNELRRAPELVSEYKTSMAAFDQSRVDQPEQHNKQRDYTLPCQPHDQPQEQLRHLGPPFVAGPPTPVSGNGDDHGSDDGDEGDYGDDDDDDDDDDNDEDHDDAEDDERQMDNHDRQFEEFLLLQNQENTASHDHQAVKHLLRLPEIDIPPEQRKATPIAMSCTLMDHQKVCLTWLMEQEDDPKKKGGILADTMGLGKTIQSLALILAHPSPDPTRKTTLIVAPLALLKQWEEEIASKVKPAYKLKTLVFHGNGKRRVTPAKLLSYDVVLTTYGTLIWEYKIIDEGRKNKKPVILHDDVTFHRVILDEAHKIKTRKGKSALGAAKIKANYRLCMTGTPFMNKVREIYSLIRFLRIKPYDEWSRFNADFDKPIENWGGNAGDRAMQKLQTLFRSITLRRTKTSMLDGKPILQLPPIHKWYDITKFNDDQQAFYTALETRQKLEVNRFLKKGMTMREYTYILVLLLRLRQACCHPHLIRDFGIPAGIEISSDDMCNLASKLRKGAVEKLKGQDEFQCPLCQSTTKNPLIISPCGHPVCSPCFSIMTEIKRPDAEAELSKCPHEGCRALVKTNKIICWCFFLEIHMPEKLEADADNDDSDDDSDDYSEDDSEDEDDVDEDGNLKDFIVSGSEDEEDEEDEEEEDDEEEFEEEAEEGDASDSENSESDNRAIENKMSRHSLKSGEEASNEAMKNEEPMEKNLDDDSDSDLESVGEICRQGRNDSSKSVKNSPAKSSKRKFTSTTESDSDEWKPSRSIGKRKRSTNKFTSSRKKSKGNDSAGGKRRKRKNKFVSLAALKKASSTNAAAKKKYLNKLRKDWVPSAKIDKTMEILHGIREKNPKEKTLIFSLWTSFLDLLEIPVIDQGFNYVRYDGSMSGKNRDQALKTFMDSPDVQIMLVSLLAGNAGLNLTAATNVIILEPFWNPFIEEQAIDRAHRIGQKNEVTVHRILIQGTVEDRIRALQEKKQELVDAALSEEGAKGVSNLSVSELKGLFGIGS